jgi:hypothetical protein
MNIEIKDSTRQMARDSGDASETAREAYRLAWRRLDVAIAWCFKYQLGRMLPL